MGQRESKPTEAVAPSGDPQATEAGSFSRAVQLWALLRPTLNHDLPNMLVALQGLLQMLRLEESSGLSPAGQDYLHRLSALADKMQGTILCLRQINKAGTIKSPPETVALADLLQEVAAACKKQLGGVPVLFHLNLKISQVAVPRLLLYQALTEIVRLQGSVSGQNELSCLVISRRAKEGVELALGMVPRLDRKTSLAPPPDGAVSPAGKVDYNLFGPEKRLGLILVEEMARNWGGKVRICETPEQVKWVCLTIPSEPVPER